MTVPTSTPATAADDNAPSLGDLVVAVGSRRDKVAFAGLFAHFAPRLKAYLMRSGCEGTAAEEVVQGLEDIGGALLEDVAPEAVSDGALAAVMARIDGEAPTPAPTRQPLSGDAIAVPEPLRSYLGGGLDSLDWRRTMRGLDVHEVKTGRPELKTRLLKIKAGTPMLEHTHHGQEFTLVLTGGYSDERGHFTRGDIDITDDSVRHTPVADAGEDCICLTLTQAPLKLTGPFGRLLNPFVKF